MNRIKELDILRGLLIILMVVGHSYDTGMSHYHLFCWEDYIYLFHMPGFFLLSGMLIKQDYKLIDRIKERFHRLIIPYIVYLSIIGGGTALIKIVIDGDIYVFLKDIAKLILGGNFLVESNVAPIWFLPVLWFSEVAILVVLKMKNCIVQLAIFFMIWCFGHWLAIHFMIPYPLNILVISVGIVYMACGYGFVRYRDSGILLVGAVCVLGVYFSGKFVFGIGYFQEYGLELAIFYFRDYILDLLIPFAFFVILYQICRIISIFKISSLISEIGKNTLPILGLHILVFVFIHSIGIESEGVNVILGVFVPYLFSKYVFVRNRHLKYLV